MRKVRKVLFTLFAVIVLGGGAMVAFANWTADGTGSGSAKAVSAQSATVTAATPTGCLYPGKSCPVQFTITNPNPYPVSFDKLTASNLVSGDPTNCAVNSSNATLDTGEKTLATPYAVGADSTSGTLTSPDLITMPSTAANGCQAVSFTATISLSGTQT